MTEEQRKRFTVISSTKTEEDNYSNELNYTKERFRAYQTNPLKIQGDSLREQFMKFTNGEGGRRFTVEDLLRGC